MPLLKDGSKRLKPALDKLYSTFDFKRASINDPVSFPMRYKEPLDIECSGFIASAMSYGRVGLFMPVIEKILSKMGKSPHEYISNLKPKQSLREFQGISYRFNRGTDVSALIYVLGIAYRKYGSLKSLFLKGLGKTDMNVLPALEAIYGWFANADTSPIYGTATKPRGYMQFFPLPSGGSACKRANMFLRWMVRDKDIDFGIWKDVGKHRLIIPLDAHIARISRCLGLARYKSAGMKAAVEITSNLKLLDPHDPLKYDFSLCHTGISGACSKKSCADCMLNKTD